MDARHPSLVRTALVGAVAGAVTGLVLGAAPATAAPAAPAAAGNNPGAVAGYVSAVSDAPRHTLSGSFRVPRATCPAPDTDPLYVTIVQFGTVAGTSTSGYVDGELMATCAGGTVAYTMVATSPAGRTTAPVAPGDQLTVKLGTTATSSSSIVTDTTTGVAVRSTGAGISATGAQASVQGGFSGSAFPATGAIPFAALRADNVAFGRLSPTGYDEVDGGGQVVLRASAFNDSGLGFTVFRPAAR